MQLIASVGGATPLVLETDLDRDVLITDGCGRAVRVRLSPVDRPTLLR